MWEIRNVGGMHLGKGEECGEMAAVPCCKQPGLAHLPEEWVSAGVEKEPCGHVGIRVEEKLGMRRAE